MAEIGELAERFGFHAIYYDHNIYFPLNDSHKPPSRLAFKKIYGHDAYRKFD